MTATSTLETSTTEEVPYQLSAEKMMMDNLFILGMLFFIFYFLLIRPQQKRVKLLQAMMKGLQKGNKIITSGGIIGIIHKLEGDDIIVLEVAQGVKIRVARSAVTEVLSEKGVSESANDN
jgi:preprotein translocase subunit YajC